MRGILELELLKVCIFPHCKMPIHPKFQIKGHELYYDIGNHPIYTYKLRLACNLHSENKFPIPHVCFINTNRRHPTSWTRTFLNAMHYQLMIDTTNLSHLRQESSSQSHYNSTTASHREHTPSTATGKSEDLLDRLAPVIWFRR